MKVYKKYKNNNKINFKYNNHKLLLKFKIGLSIIILF